MEELALNILDIAQNALAAGAGIVEITIDESDEALALSIRDDGCGMDAETLEAAQSPFFTTRTTRSIGLGLPLLKQAAEQTGGSFSISSRPRCECPECSGTEVKADFNKKHIDFMPLGNIVETVTALIQGAPDVEIIFTHRFAGGSVALDTRELRLILGDDAMDDPLVLRWIRMTLEEQYSRAAYTGAKHESRTESR